MRSTTGERHFLDTNLLVHANDQGDLRRRLVAARLVSDGIWSRRAVVSSQVLSEFLLTVTRKVRTPLPQEVAEAKVLRLGSMSVVAAGYDTVVLALHLMRRYVLSYWDSLILAAAQTASCGVVMSEDLSHGQRYGDVLVQNPFIP